MKFDESLLYNIKSDYQGIRYSLFNLAIWKNGLAFKKIDFSDKGLPVIKIAELNNGISSNTSFTQGDYGKEFFVQWDDLLFSWSGNPQTSIDVFRYRLPDGWLNQHIFKVTANSELVTKDFLYYTLKYLKPYFTQIAINKQTTGLGHVTIADLKRMSVVIPKKEIQEQVTSILKVIDDKIEVNSNINENLLQQLHVLYLRLFCDSAMDTPLGDVVATTSGGTPSRKHDEYYSDSSICWVKSKELLGNYIHETEEHINDLAIKKSSAKLLPKHSVLIAMYGATVGAYGVISKPMTCNQAVCALLCNENYPYTYLFQIAYESQQKFINLAVGSAQQNISQVLIKQLNLHSDLDIIQRFHDLALPMHQEIEFLQAENISLSNLRNKLLPKLMSGEFDVSNIQL